ncbi:hypothetical protein PGB28_14110 [Primorskyibacter aestuariivivens]|uniref:hypothetical protein n=1 Tax=Primorskyibacter aestuariivivens TaxID=1888912 RepID=UPI0022FFC6E2|nr:hypothetical protein [Primorskyibacter aestuariivivens]MDA7429600.1 hypothetical protein [Primorskyibacter aestuariivivens]
MTFIFGKPFYTKMLGASIIALAASAAHADFVINDDLIVDGSACIGFDCVNGEAFGFDTIRLKENNLRIKFDDTSTAASFPRNDWQLTANDSANGGASKFSIDDISGSRTPFTIEANARSHSLYVDDGGRIGSRTSTPSTEIHTVDGDTPTLRLQQDGSSGFAPQTWDVAGNETNFFIRDVTNGSTLPLRIRPGAPSSAVFIDTDGDVGLGTASPDAPLDVEVSANLSNTEANVLINNTNATAAQRLMMVMSNNGGAEVQLENRASGVKWNIRNANGGPNFLINDPDSPNTELTLTAAGDLLLEGNFISNGTTLNVPDYVFADDYELMPITQVADFIKENRHLPNIPSAAEINAGHLDLTRMQLSLLEKVEELTLYTIEQDARINELTRELETLRN